MKKKSARASYKEQRKKELEKQQKTNRRLMWITAVSVIVIIALAVIFKPKPAPVAFDYNALPVLGSKDAPVKIVEFGDYKCPSCQFFSQEIVPQIEKDYIDKGLVSLHFMNFPFLGPDSTTAALAAQSVFHQSNEAFWKFNDALYKKQGNESVQWATPEFLTNLIRSDGIAVDANKVLEDINKKTYASEVDEHYSKGHAAGVTGTPSIFINGVKFSNSLDYGSIKAAIDQALKGEGQ